jgi:S-adenosyl methyltransferase
VDGIGGNVMLDERKAPPGVDPTVPSPARLYDYYLGGSYNYQADRDAAERIRAVGPELTDGAWANRGFHGRAARWMAGQGVSQFIDIGAGLPTAGNTHEAVQTIHAGARVVYVDNDPVVHAHSNELLADNPAATLIEADLRDPNGLLGHQELRKLIDFSQPTGLLMTYVLHFVSDGADPWKLVRRYVDALSPGSYLALSHGTTDNVPPRSLRILNGMYDQATEKVYFRPKADIERFFDGLEIVSPYTGADPAVVHVGLWGCEDVELADTDGSRWGFCAVARKP